jgi:hypothetical protein
MLPMTRRARLMKLQQQAAEMEGAQPDVSQLQQFAAAQGRAGEAAMLNALAAQYAGEQFQPVQAQFLKRAMAAQEPMKIGGGMLTPDGQFVQDPFATQERGLRRLDTLINREQGAISAEDALAQRRADALQRDQDRKDREAADRRFREEQARTANDFRRLSIDLQRQGLDLRRQIAGVDDTASGPMPTASNNGAPLKPGFYETTAPKLNENQSKARTRASGMAQHVPDMESSLSSGYRPSRTDLLAVGPDLPGMSGIAQKFVPRSQGSPEGVKFMTAGRKVLSLLLRGESGGAITADEWTSYGPMYLPWPGDDDKEIERKIKDLRRYANDVAFEAGPSAKRWFGFDVNAPVFKPKEDNDGVVDLTPKPR